jgi:FKBP-type peptidyl-prolyl cis-trans isomerase FkpA
LLVKSILFASLVVVPPLACARREKLAVTSASIYTGMPTDGTVSAPPFIPTNADAICGEHWKWDGVRCIKLEGASDPNPPASASGAPRPRRAINEESSAAQVVIKDLKEGTGPEAMSGDLVRIHYVGTLSDGKEFDSSRKRGEAFEFRLGGGSTIRGFDTAVTGMKVGGTRRATIPPELGYGRRGMPPSIPPNSTLTFEVELLEITPRSGNSE